MPLAMRDKVFITAALTGSGSTQDRSDKVPRSPEQIATAAIDAAKAGAAVVHCHVRDPETGAPDRAVHLYCEVVERIRASDTDVVINLTAGMGGDIVFGPTDAPLPLSVQGTDMVSAAERVAHLGTLVRWEGTLDLRSRTLAALQVGRHFRAQYVWGIQGIIAEERSIARATVDAIRDERDDHIPEADRQIVEFTRQLLSSHRVEDGLATAMLERFGADEYVQLTTCIGYYAMLAMTVSSSSAPESIRSWRLPASMYSRTSDSVPDEVVQG